MTTSEMTRRGVLVGTAALFCAPGAHSLEPAPAPAPAAPRTTHVANPSSQIAALEKREGGRLGVVAIDTATGHRLEHRANERFALCSTFKFLAAAAILQRVDQGAERLDRMIEFSESDLLELASVSKPHVKTGGMPLADVCSAAVEWSDNTAANSMLKILGGPKGLTAFIRTLGDNITRLDRTEPSLNVVAPGEVHDTTTPASMVGLLSTVIFGQVLAPASRSLLERWMLEAKVGEHRIPAGLPPGWRIGHKTGTYGDYTNDVGIIWPVNRAPIVIAAYYSRGGTSMEQREGVLRDVGRIVSTSF